MWPFFGYIMSKKTNEPLKKANPQGEHQVFKSLLVVKNISNKERWRFFENMPSLNEPSLTTIAHFKIKIIYAHYNITHTLYIQNAQKIEKGGPLMPFVPHTMLAHCEKTCPLISVNIWNPLQLKGKTCPLIINHNKNHTLLELQLLQLPNEEKKSRNQINSKGIDNDNICQRVDIINW